MPVNKIDQIPKVKTAEDLHGKDSVSLTVTDKKTDAALSGVNFEYPHTPLKCSAKKAEGKFFLSNLLEISPKKTPECIVKESSIGASRQKETVSIRLDKNPLEKACRILFDYQGDDKGKVETQRQILKGVSQVIDEIKKVDEENEFDDGFNFEKTMLLYYKAMVDLIKEDSITLQSTLKQLEVEQKKIGETRAKEYQKIIDRMGRKKWFHGLNLAGTITGGIAGTVAISLAGAGIPALIGAVAGTIILSVLIADKTFDHPLEKMLKDYFPENLVHGSEAFLSVSGMLLYATIQTFGIIGMVTNGIAETGMAITEIQNKHTEKNLEKLKNRSTLKSDELDNNKKFMEFVSNEMKKHLRTCRQLMKKPNIFN